MERTFLQNVDHYFSGRIIANMQFLHCDLDEMVCEELLLTTHDGNQLYITTLDGMLELTVVREK